MFTAVVLLGIKDKVMFDLAWAVSACKDKTTSR